jgi:hypothetical protein
MCLWHCVIIRVVTRYIDKVSCAADNGDMEGMVLRLWVRPLFRRFENFVRKHAQKWPG